MNTSLVMPQPPKGRPKRPASKPSADKAESRERKTPGPDALPVKAFRIHPDIFEALRRRANSLNAAGDLPGRATRSGVLNQLLRAALREELEGINAEKAAGTYRPGGEDDEEKPS